MRVLLFSYFLVAISVEIINGQRQCPRDRARECTKQSCRRQNQVCPDGTSCGCEEGCGMRCLLVCPLLHGDNSTVSYGDASRRFNTTAHYQCLPGYALADGSPNPTRRCQDNGRWTGRKPMCQIIVCPLLNGDNARVSYDDTSRRFNTTAHYQCLPGYVLADDTPNPIRRCQANGRWSGSRPRCLQESIGSSGRCERDTVEVMFMRRVCSPTCSNSENCRGNRECVCDDICGLTCVPTGRSDYCSELPMLDEDHVERIVYEPPTRTFNSIATYHCAHNFNITGRNYRRCLGAEQWSDEVIICRPQDVCQPPPHFPLARLEEVRELYVPGNRIYYTCDYGYYKQGNGYIQCQSNGTWTSRTFECLPKSCGDPGNVINGRRMGSTFSFLSRVTYRCDAGYDMDGISFRTCQSNQQWSNSLPVCNPKPCPALFPPVDGSLRGNRFLYPESVTFHCIEGYITTGPAVLTCQSDGSWDHTPPRCTEIQCRNPEPIANVRITPGRSVNRLNDEITFSCTSLYETLNGTDTLRCTETEEWSAGIPTCGRRCILPTPSNLNGNYLNRRNRQHINHGEIISINCDVGYSSDSGQLTCNDGNLDPGIVCSPDPCLKFLISAGPNLMVQYHPPQNQRDVVTYGTVARFSCLTADYDLVGERVLVCDPGRWNHEMPSCALSCLGVVNDRYASVGYSKRSRGIYYSSGTKAILQCHAGLVLNGINPVCQSGSWGTLPLCVAPSGCRSPEVDDHFSLSYNRNAVAQGIYPSGTVVTISCAPGRYNNYGEQQSETYTCNTDNNWNRNSLPTCIENVAHEKLATQSSTYRFNMAARNAVDGFIDVQHNNYKCTHTRDKTDGRRPWWIVDLGRTYRISRIIIFNRESGRNHASRLDGAEIKFGDSSQVARNARIALVSTHNWRGAVVNPIIIDLRQQSLDGRYLSFHLTGISGKILTLCEVIVFGELAVSDDACHRLRDTDDFEDVVYSTHASNGLYPDGTTATVTCAEHMLLSTNQLPMCSNGEWSDVPVCRQTCLRLSGTGNFEDVVYSTSASHGFYPDGTTVTVTCAEHMQLSSNQPATCSGGQWRTVPVCIQRACAEPPTVQNAEVESSGFPHGSVRRWECHEGYVIVGADRIQCQEGEWSASPPSCEQICDDAPEVENAHKVQTGSQSRLEATYSCNGMLSIIGNASIVCRRGEWNSQPPLCTEMLDACSNFECPEGKECHVRAEGPRCACKQPNSCELDGQPVCGTNGVTFRSACHLHVAACLLQEDIQVESVGECSEDTNSESSLESSEEVVDFCSVTTCGREIIRGTCRGASVGSITALVATGNEIKFTSSNSELNITLDVSKWLINGNKFGNVTTISLLLPARDRCICPNFSDWSLKNIIILQRPQHGTFLQAAANDYVSVWAEDKEAKVNRFCTRSQNNSFVLT